MLYYSGFTRRLGGQYLRAMIFLWFVFAFGVTHVLSLSQMSTKALP
jgi:hypothetical protein